MGPFDVIFHVFNLFMPAAAMALGMGLLLRLPVLRRLAGRSNGPWLRQVKLTFYVGCGAIVLGWVVFGVDGKMATYALLVVSTACVHWWRTGR
jgi:hypothetical protein